MKAINKLTGLVGNVTMTKHTVTVTYEMCATPFTMTKDDFIQDFRLAEGIAIANEWD